MRRAPLVLSIASLLLLACGDDDAATPSGPPMLLSGWGLFADPIRQVPAEGVVPYSVNAPLFADFAGKWRFVRLPEGGRITYAADGLWQFPQGTVFVKTFSFVSDLRDPQSSEQLVETRLLVRSATSWDAFTYVWDDAQTDATLTVAGRRVAVSWTAEDGSTEEHEYRVPASNQCSGCHGLGTNENQLLGLRTRQLERDHDFGAGLENQIDHFAALGLFDAPPQPAGSRDRLVDPYLDGDVEPRARSWLEANCAHCHRPEAAATASGVFFNVENEDPTTLGVCRIPFAAGRGTGGRPYDITPGSPSESILMFRIQSTEPGIKMPEMPIALVDEAGVDLVRQWIAAMPPDDCR